MATVPAYTQLMNPVLRAMRELGGSATTEELASRVIKNEALGEDVTSVPHGDGGQTEVEYRLAWARTYLKKIGMLENSGRGVWALTPKGREVSNVDPRSVANQVRKMGRSKEEFGPAEKPEVELEQAWSEALLARLHVMDPAAFERLCQRLLRESGFVEVDVTGRTGDGGIDGHGILRLAGMISFRVAFQAKRHQANVGSAVVRDFRGAMVGRADKGLIITTAGFTPDARKEAVRDGAPPIDLVDGEELVQKLKELRLGVVVKTRTVEDVAVDEEWLSKV